MWKKKGVAERWEMAEGIYLPKEENSEKLGQFRPISLLNIDGKIMFGIIAKRIIDFVRSNGYIDESVQKAGIPQLPGCVEHAYAIWEGIQSAKENKAGISVIWLDLANAYGSVPHAMIEEAMDFFWLPVEVRKMIMEYYDRFQMRFTTNDFTTDWQRLEVGIAAGCTISVVLFILAMEMILKSTNTKMITMKPTLKAFMDDITIMTGNVEGGKRVLERLDEVISQTRMKFKASKSRSCTIINGKAKEIHFSIAGERIPTVKEEPVKSLGRWYENGLNDRHKGMEIFRQTEDGLKAIDKTKLSGKFKVWCLQYGQYPRLQWPLMMYEVGASRVEKIEQKCSLYIRKWLKLPKQLNNSAIYGKKQQLKLPIPSIFEEYKSGKVRTVMMLRYSKDEKIRENPPEVRTYYKWRAEEEVDDAISRLEHQDLARYNWINSTGKERVWINNVQTISHEQ